MSKTLIAYVCYRKKAIIVGITAIEWLNVFIVLMRFNFIFALPYSICVSQIGLAIIIPPILLIFVFLLQSYDFLLRRQCFLDKYLHDMM